MSSNQKFLIVIAGPTAVGKTQFAIEVAQHFQTEIVNADSRQIYKEMEIGTAVPTSEERLRVKHHLIQSHSIHQAISAGEYEKIALKRLEELFENFNEVVLTGGSGLFIDALIDGIEDHLPPPDPEVRKALENKTLHELQRELCEKDPQYYSEADIHNPHRLIRALEVIQLTQKTYSSQRTAVKKNRSFKSIKICLHREREELYKRINQRVDDMMSRGLLDEAQGLTPYQNLKSLNTVGYKELFAHLNGKSTLDEAINLIKQNSRRYAKRQLTWFKRDKNYKWFTPKEVSQTIEWIESQIKKS